MLVVTRKARERVIIRVPGADPIAVEIVHIRGDKVRIGFAAAPHVVIHREEVDEKLRGDEPRPAA